MTTHRRDPDAGRPRMAIAVWENEGGAQGRNPTAHQYGRRIEADRSWSVYHVYTGVPAHVGGLSMTGLSRADATAGMLSLNRTGEERGQTWRRLPARGPQTLASDEVLP